MTEDSTVIYCKCKMLRWMAKKNFPFRLQTLETFALPSPARIYFRNGSTVLVIPSCSFILKSVLRMLRAEFCTVGMLTETLFPGSSYSTRRDT